MRGIIVAFICAPLFAGNPGLAEESTLPQPVPSATVRALTSTPGGEIRDKSPDKTVDHLLQAAEHLEAAGLSEEASRLRAEARRRALRDDLLGRKESELECLQEEVDRLRALTGHVSTIMIRIVAVEVDRRKLGLRAGEFDRMVGLPASNAAGSGATFASRPQLRPTSPDESGITEINPARLPLFRELLEKGAIRVLAEPNLTTLSGRVAEFMDGGLAPVRMRSPGGVVGVEHVWFGTRFEVLATLLPGQRIRLKTVFELRPRVISDVAGDDGGEQTGISVQRISNSMEFLVGQTMTLARTIKSHGEDQDEQAAVGEPNSTAHKLSNPRAETELIVFLTPELMHSPIAPRALHGVPDDATDDESSKMIEPAVFEPVDWDAFGPPMPVMKRRTPRE